MVGPVIVSCNRVEILPPAFRSLSVAGHALSVHGLDRAVPERARYMQSTAPRRTAPNPLGRELRIDPEAEKKLPAEAKTTNERRPDHPPGYRGASLRKSFESDLRTLTGRAVCQLQSSRQNQRVA